MGWVAIIGNGRRGHKGKQSIDFSSKSLGDGTNPKDDNHFLHLLKISEPVPFELLRPKQSAHLLHEPNGYQFLVAYHLPSHIYICVCVFLLCKIFNCLLKRKKKGSKERNMRQVKGEMGKEEIVALYYRKRGTQGCRLWNKERNVEPMSHISFNLHGTTLETLPL